jgi:hypothetical protein
LSSGDGTFTAFVAFATSGSASSARLLRVHQRNRVVDFGAEEA